MRDGRMVAPADAQGDFYAAAPMEPGRQVVHWLSCTRAPCRCFGLTAEVRDHPGCLELRLRDNGETVCKAELAVTDGMLVLSAAAVMRASTTGDWLQHYLVVAEVMLREAVAVADQRGAALAVPPGRPAALLAELGFTEMTETMAVRPAVGPAGHGLLRTPQTRSRGRYAAWCVCGEERRADTLGAAHEAVFAHIGEVRLWLAGPGPQNITLAPDAAGTQEAS